VFSLDTCKSLVRHGSMCSYSTRECVVDYQGQHLLFVPVLVFPMAGDDDEIEAVIPTEFADCVSREDLKATCKRMEEKMDETVHKSVHDALIAMDLGTILDRLEKRMTELVDRVATLETRPPAAASTTTAAASTTASATSTTCISSR
jgi:hypothetical protein